MLGIECLHPLQTGPRCFPAEMLDGNGSSGDAFIVHGLPTVLLCSKASQPHRQWQETPARSERGARGAVKLPVSCREKISCPAFQGCLHALDLDLQPGCPWQELLCHCHSSCKEATIEQVLEQDCSSSLLSPKTSVQLLPSWTLGWPLLVPTRPLFIQSCK